MNQIPAFTLPVEFSLTPLMNLMTFNQLNFNHALPNLMNLNNVVTQNTIHSDVKSTDRSEEHYEDAIFETTKKRRLNNSTQLVAQKIRTDISSSEEEDDDCILLGSITKNTDQSIHPLSAYQSVFDMDRHNISNNLNYNNFHDTQLMISNPLALLLQNNPSLNDLLLMHSNMQYNSCNPILFNPFSYELAGVNSLPAFTKEDDCITQYSSLKASRVNSTEHNHTKNASDLIFDESPCLTPPQNVNKELNSLVNITPSCQETKMGIDSTSVISPLDNKSSIKGSHAIIPKFTGVRRSADNKMRKVKSVWSPSSIGYDNYLILHKKIEEAVAMEITDEEKVIRTLKEHNMDVGSACEKLRRNKANFKHFFKVQKLPRIQKMI